MISKPFHMTETTPAFAEKSFFINETGQELPLEDFVPVEILEMAEIEGQRAIPGIAKNISLMKEIEAISSNVPTRHRSCMQIAETLRFSLMKVFIWS